jgi:hypothetical protein
MTVCWLKAVATAEEVAELMGSCQPERLRNLSAVLELRFKDRLIAAEIAILGNAKNGKMTPSGVESRINDINKVNRLAKGKMASKQNPGDI